MLSDKNLKKSEFRPSLDGIRTLCIIFTILHHIKGVPNVIIGNVGVDVFFALSGFLITYLLAKDFEYNKRAILKSFYIRRFFRIVPLYYLTILFYVLGNVVLKKWGKYDATHDMTTELHMFLLFIPEFISGHTAFFHAWTLGIEEKFYILWPLGMWMIFKYRSYYLTTAIMCISAVLLTYYTNFPHLVIRGYFGLAAGAALYMFILNNQKIQHYFKSNSIANIAVIFMLLFYILIYLTDSFIFNMLISFCSAFLIASLWYNESSVISKFLSSKLVAYPGKLTYGIYLLHVLVINVVTLIISKLNIAEHWLLTFFIVYILSFCLTHLLHSYFEKPLINLGRALANKLGTV